MDRRFWLERWELGEIGFHQSQHNPHLVAHWESLSPPPRARPGVFVPLCGKSGDMRWLADQGYPVVGVEFSERAVREFFAESGLEPTVYEDEDMLRFEAGEFTLYCGDFYEINALHLRHVGSCYDRAALVALPPKLRAIYADHLQRILPDGAKTLLLTFEYDQRKVNGPPFAVSMAEVLELYQARCQVTELATTTTDLMPPKFAAAGVPEVTERVIRIDKRD